MILLIFFLVCHRIIPWPKFLHITTIFPPNALIYEKAQISIKEMVKHGMVLNVMAIALISIFTIFVSVPFFS